MTQALNIEQISSSLNQLLSQLQSFEATLTQETDILKSSNMDRLDETLAHKEQLADQITQSFAEFLTQANIPVTSLQELAAHSDIQALPESTQQQLQDVIDLANTCQTLNNTNGMMVHSLSNINRTFLNILKGQDTTAETYGSSGKTDSPELKHSAPLSKA